MKELLLSVRVDIAEPAKVQGKHMRVAMLPFTGNGYGDYFNGEIIGTGCDTQKIPSVGLPTLSARYMLQGTDKDGQECKVFIENTLHDERGWHPIIVTDSKCLSEWEDLDLIATVDGAPGGVLVRIYKDM